MRSLTPLLLMIAVCAAGEAGETGKGPPFEWRQLHGAATHDNYRDREDGIAVPKVLWHRPESVGQPAISGEWLYCGGPLLGRIAASSGKFERSPKADARRVGATPVVTDDRVIFRRPEGGIQAYTRDLRRLIWQRATEAPDIHTDYPAVCDGGYYVFTENGSVRALRVRDGKDAWVFNTHRGEVALTPAIANGRVFFGSVAGRVWSIDLKSGRELWRFEGRESYGWSNPVIADGLLVMADRGIQYAGEPGRKGELRALAAVSGALRWTLPYGESWISSPGHSPNRIVLGTRRRVMQVDPQTGKEIRPRIQIEAAAFGTPAIVGTTLYFGTNDGYLHARDLRTGKPRWRLHIPGTTPKLKSHEVRSIVHTGTRIYVETTNGLYCLGQDPNRRGVRPQGETIEAGR